MIKSEIGVLSSPLPPEVQERWQWCNTVYLSLTSTDKKTGNYRATQMEREIRGHLFFIIGECSEIRRKKKEHIFSLVSWESLKRLVLFKDCFNYCSSECLRGHLSAIHPLQVSKSNFNICIPVDLEKKNETEIVSIFNTNSPMTILLASLPSLLRTLQTRRFGSTDCINCIIYEHELIALTRADMEQLCWQVCGIKKMTQADWQ